MSLAEHGDPLSGKDIQDAMSNSTLNADQEKITYLVREQKFTLQGQ
jgi:hypothetical protein